MTTQPPKVTAAQMAEWCHPRRPVGMPDIPAVSMTEPPERLLGVWAHPDDEAYLSAGLMARTIKAGGQVTLLTLTDGEEGFSADDPRPATERAEHRRKELLAAMSTIGVTDVRFLGIPDGALAQSEPTSVIDAIKAVIDEIDPTVTVTFGPDGVTGHSDHIANSSLVTRAWNEDRHGELWYAAKTTEWLDAWRDLHDEFGVWMTEEPTGVSSDEIEFVVDMGGSELDQKRSVLAEHRSQTEGLAAAFGEDRYLRWISQEAFRFPTEVELATADRTRSDQSSVLS